MEGRKAVLTLRRRLDCAYYQRTDVRPLAVNNKSSWNRFIRSLKQTHVKTDVWDAEIAPFTGNRVMNTQHAV